MNVAFRWIAPQPHLEAPANSVEVSRLFVVYGLGYMAVFVIIALLYRRAWTKQKELSLTPAEVFNARMYAGAHLLSAGVGLLSVIWALVTPGNWPSTAGLVYFLMAPVQTIYGSRMGRKRRLLGFDGGR